MLCAQINVYGVQQPFITVIGAVYGIFALVVYTHEMLVRSRGKKSKQRDGES